MQLVRPREILRSLRVGVLRPVGPGVIIAGLAAGLLILADVGRSSETARHVRRPGPRRRAILITSTATSPGLIVVGIQSEITGTVISSDALNDSVDVLLGVAVTFGVLRDGDRPLDESLLQPLNRPGYTTAEISRLVSVPHRDDPHTHGPAVLPVSQLESPGPIHLQEFVQHRITVSPTEMGSRISQQEPVLLLLIHNLGLDETGIPEFSSPRKDEILEAAAFTLHSPQEHAGHGDHVAPFFL